MNSSTSGSQAGERQERVDARQVDRWLAALGLHLLEQVERDAITSWDLVLDGRRRMDIRVTLILEPSTGLFLWVHFAPALNDNFRKSYRQFLRWNDELPFVKFCLSPDDERPMLTSELSTESLSEDRLGLALARLVAVCDLLLEESAHWLWLGGKAPAREPSPPRNVGFLDRFAEGVRELAPVASEDRGAQPTEERA